MKSITLKPLAIALGAAFTAGLSASSASAADNPFAMKELSSGYMVAGRMGEGSCGGKKSEGRCGAKMKELAKLCAQKVKEGFCGEGKCGEGKCGSSLKEKCANLLLKMAGEKAKEGKCGEGKCGNKK